MMLLGITLHLYNIAELRQTAYLVHAPLERFRIAV